MTTAALSDVADTVLNQVVELVEPELLAKWESQTPAATPFWVLASSAGARSVTTATSISSSSTRLMASPSQGEPNSLYFTELAQRIIRTMSR